ncbi:peptidase M28, partial [Bacillus haynesii]|nr:peptidase M28 [Bacillus haynesii]
VMNNEKMLLAKAWDNRIGCAIAIDVLKNLKGADHPNVVYGVGTVQEEVGLRGAKT